MKKRNLYILFNILGISSLFFISSCANNISNENCVDTNPTLDTSINDNNIISFIEDNNYIYQITDKQEKQLSIFKYKDNINNNIIKISSNTKINNIEYKITEIGYKVFENKKISELDISSSNILKINEYAFKDNNIQSLILPESLNEISDFAFYNNKIKEVQLTKNIKRIGKYAFANNEISKVNFSTLSLGIDFINKDWTDINKKELKQLYEGEFLYELEDFSFSKNKIENLVIPDYVIIMNCGVFYDNQIKEVKINSYQNSYMLCLCNSFDSETKIIKN